MLQIDSFADITAILDQQKPDPHAVERKTRHPATPVANAGWPIGILDWTWAVVSIILCCKERHIQWTASLSLPC